MRIRRTMATVGAAALTLAGMVVLGDPASAGHVSCGAVITQSITLDNNLTNCPGDGLRIQGSNIVVNLAGRTISGRASTNTTPLEQAGIRLMNVTGVTVTGGTITNFDAGVVIGRGSGNTITRLQVLANINHSTLTGTLNPCDLGDGILALDSDNNTIRNNVAEHNGPFSGISLVGDSDGNRVSHNLVRLQDVDNTHPNFVTPQRPAGNGPCGPFTPPAGTVGAPNQDIGIRIEGPGADNNRVEYNQVADNMVFGITIHGNVCHPPGNVFPPQPNNGNNVISRNIVTGNGFGGAPPATPLGQGDGIAVVVQGPDAIVCVAFANSILQNIVTGNAGHGILLGGRGSHSNTINGNTVRNNGRDGIRVTGPGGPGSRCGVVLTSPCPGAINNTLVGNNGAGNVEHDADDRNPACDNNRWRNNSFGTVFQGCERNG